MPNTAAERDFRQVAVGVLRRDQRILIARRPPPADAGERPWEFPGGKFEPGETAEQALRRELAEELGVETLEARLWLRFRHRYPAGGVELHVFRALHFTGAPRGREGQALRWISAQELAETPFHAGNLPIVAGLRREAGL